MATLNSVLRGGHSQPQSTSVGDARLFERIRIHVSIYDFTTYHLLIVMQGKFFFPNNTLGGQGLSRRHGLPKKV